MWFENLIFQWWWWRWWSLVPYQIQRKYLPMHHHPYIRGWKKFNISKVKVVMVVVVVLSPLPTNSKANISQCIITCGVEKIGHEQHLFHYWVCFPFNAMNYLSIEEALFIDGSSKNISLL
jgi:hypothetical protein